MTRMLFVLFSMTACAVSLFAATPEKPNVIYSGYINGNYAVLIQPTTLPSSWLVETSPDNGASWSQLCNSLGGTYSYGGGNKANKSTRVLLASYVGAAARVRVRAVVGGEYSEPVELDEIADGIAVTSMGTTISSSGYGLAPANVFDGNPSTIFDGDGNATFNWLGKAFAEPVAVSQIRLVPRLDLITRCDGGYLQAANEADFSDAETLYVIPSGTDYSKPIVISFSEPVTARYFRYCHEGTMNGADLSEMEFVGDYESLKVDIVAATVAKAGQAGAPTVSWSVPIMFQCASAVLECSDDGETDWTTCATFNNVSSGTFADTTLSNLSNRFYRVTATCGRADGYAGQTKTSQIVSFTRGLPLVWHAEYYNGNLAINIVKPSDPVGFYDVEVKEAGGDAWVPCTTTRGTYSFGGNSGLASGNTTVFVKGEFAGPFSVRVRAVLYNAEQDKTPWVQLDDFYAVRNARGVVVGSPSNSGLPWSNAFDGNPGTICEASTSSGGWVGYDYGEGGQTIVAARVVFRFDFPSRLVGGRVQASDNADFSTIVAETPIVPASYETDHVRGCELKFAEPVKARYFRYLSADNCYCDFGDLEFIPSALPDFTATVNAQLADDKVVVSWTVPPVSAASVVVQRAPYTSGELAWTDVTEVIPYGSNTWSDVDVGAGRVYLYRIKATVAHPLYEATTAFSPASDPVAPEGELTWVGGGATTSILDPGNWEGLTEPPVFAGNIVAKFPANAEVMVPDDAAVWLRKIQASGSLTIRGSFVLTDGVSVSSADGATVMVAGAVTVAGNQIWDLGAAALVWEGTMLNFAGREDSTVSFRGCGEMSFTGSGQGDFAGLVNVLPTVKRTPVHFAGKDPFGLAELYVNAAPEIRLEGIEYTSTVRQLGGTVDGDTIGHWIAESGTTNVFHSLVKSDYQRLKSFYGVNIFEGGLQFINNNSIVGAAACSLILRDCSASNFLQVVDAPIHWEFGGEGSDLGYYYRNANSTLELTADWGYSSTKPAAFMALTQGKEKVILNGHSARFRNLSLGATASVTSDVPAMVYVNQDVIGVTEAFRTYVDGRIVGSFLGRAGLSKSGVDDLTIAGAQESSGAIEVVEGRLVFGEDGTWSNATSICVAAGAGVAEGNYPVLAVVKSKKFAAAALTIGEHGVIDVPAGCKVSVKSLTVGGRSFSDGVYKAADLPDGVLTGGGSIHVGRVGTYLIFR